MQILFLQNQINAIHYKVGGDLPPHDDKPVEPRIYYPQKLVAWDILLQAEDEHTHPPRRKEGCQSVLSHLADQANVDFFYFFFLTDTLSPHGYSGWL